MHPALFFQIRLLSYWYEIIRFMPIRLERRLDLAKQLLLV